MALNREEKSILYAYENGTLEAIAQEKARRNEVGFTHNWTTEQHLERLTKKAKELAEAQILESAKPQARHRATYNTGLGYYGTRRDAVKGFDGIE